MTEIIKKILIPLDRLASFLGGPAFGLKDVFTMVNLAGGIAAVLLVIHGHVLWASYAIMIGYLGDVVDGWVARVTGHGNRFGSEFDTITDHMAQCVAPAFVLAGWFIERGMASWGWAAAFIFISAGSIRHARAAAAKFHFPLCWKGLPRPVAAIILLSFVNSHLSVLSWAPYAGFAAVLAASWGLLTDMPFLSHHGRPLPRWVVVIVVFYFITGIALGLFMRRYFWDFLLLSMLFYSFGSWTILLPEERRLYWQEVRRWHACLEDECHDS